MIPHVVSEGVFPVEPFMAVVALEQTFSVRSHVSQQHKPASELLLANGALKRLLTGVISYVVI